MHEIKVLQPTNNL